MNSTYEVTVVRTEHITFRVEADSPEAAMECYLMDGDEIGSKTVVGPIVVNVVQVVEPEAA